MAPFDLSSVGTVGTALIFGAIGFGFGAVLEMAGFGDTRKLAAQFYLREMTVLKVMFTGIVVACVLISLSSAFGLLDLQRVWVNPTYLWPGIAGGLIMGVGFVIGGFCPGTSVVAASTGKIDGMMFLLGALVGVWGFGESVASFESFYLSSYLGRFTIPEWLGLPVGLAVLLVALMAVAMFWAAELSERFFGRKQRWAQIPLLPQSRAKKAAAAALVTACVVLVIQGQPTAEQRWERMAPQAGKAVEDREIFVHPAEVVALRADVAVKVEILDLREERDFNLFHLGGARRVAPAELERPETVRALAEKPAATVTFLVGNGEEAALAAWKRLKALGVANLYVIEGGLNRWLQLYPAPECVATPADETAAEKDALAYRFAYATGSSLPAAWPERRFSRSFRVPCGETSGPDAVWPAHAFTKKVKLQVKQAVKGGCG